MHGKGFAVVADEVRSLAAKSAEAAKDTERLIKDSMAKAELGARIASETASSFEEIVSSIGENDQIIRNISGSVSDQFLSIKAIHDEVDKLETIVSEDSGTAEENSVAAEELSAQAETMRSLVARFKLRNNLRAIAANKKDVDVPMSSAFSLQGN